MLRDNDRMRDVYETYHDKEDGLLYIQYTDVESFG